MTNIPTSQTLSTRRCRLRYISVDDIPHIFSASRVPGFTDGLLWDPPKDESELMDDYNTTVTAWQEGTEYCFTIDEKNTRAFIGRIMIRRCANEGVWILGFWTHPQQQRKGYMSESIKVMIDFTFSELEAQRINAYHATWNKVSARLLEKFGMQFQQTIPEGFQKNGQCVAENQLSLFREEWLLHKR